MTPGRLDLFNDGLPLISAVYQGKPVLSERSSDRWLVHDPQHRFGKARRLIGDEQVLLVLDVDALTT